MRSIDILGLAAAVVIALLSQIVEPWSRPWWAGMIGAGLIALAAVVHMIWRGLPDETRRVHLSPAAWTPEGKVTGGRSRSIIGALMLAVLLGGGYMASHWRSSLHPPKAEADQPTAPLPGQLLSRY